jgi:hypothetical protein
MANVGHLTMHMKRILISGLIGCSLTGLLTACLRIPTNGPTLLDLFVAVPFQILASLITKDRALGEFVYYGIQIIVFGGICYFVLSAFRWFRREGHGK